MVDETATVVIPIRGGINPDKLIEFERRWLEQYKGPEQAPQIIFQETKWPAQDFGNGSEDHE